MIKMGARSYQHETAGELARGTLYEAEPPVNENFLCVRTVDQKRN